MDLDALMADLSSIEQELSTINAKPGGGLVRLGLTDTKVPTSDNQSENLKSFEANNHVV